MKFTQAVLGMTCVLALAAGASPASAQSRERAPQRHGSYRQAQPSRQVVSRDVRVRSVRGPDRVVNRSVVRSVVPRYERQRHGGRIYSSRGRYYRPYYRTFHRPLYRPLYRPFYRPFYSSRFFFGYGWGYPYSFGGYPYLYPGFGHGFGYGYGPGWGYPYGPYGYGPYDRNGYAEDQGGIRLQMNPKQAQVTVDGYFAGVVDDFDGISQRLALEAGPHKIEITAPGYEPFTLEVNILREQTIKYKGALRPLP